MVLKKSEGGEIEFGYFLSRLYALSSIFGFYNKIHKLAIEDVQKSRARFILDVGTGPGDLPIKLAKMDNRLMVYGIDPSRDMINIAKRKSASIENVAFLVGSSTKVPMKMKFDMIISTISMRHWANKNKALSYLKKFLKKSGSIRIYEFKKTQFKLFGLINMVEQHAMPRSEMLDLGKKARMKTKIRELETFIIAEYR